MDYFKMPVTGRNISGWIKHGHHPTFFLAFILLTGCASSGLNNLAQVDPGIWRGGQPKTVCDWQQIRELLGAHGTIIKLNEDSEGVDVGEWPNALPLRVVKFPMSWKLQTFDGPELDRLVDAAVAEMEKGHCYVHCEHGVNRTGTVVGAYRLKHGWTKADAKKEMDAFGWETSLPGLKECFEKRKELR